MPIAVSNLTKIYGSQRAVDNVSFEARPGEVLGFLGPNGAGKTTTMKIITGYLPASEGSVTVNGHNVAEDSLAARRNIGYLPEHNPLYLDMYVREYLAYAGRLHRMSGKPLTSRIEELIDLTGLEREQHKQIGTLSKGYRQRVGLAQALLHDPPVLLLDEPTSGLDPNQLAEIRELIRQLGREKTVVFSTHIMQEVQAVCDRVLIINQGKLVADDPIERLRERLSDAPTLVIELAGNIVKTDRLESIAGIARAADLGGGRFRITAKPGAGDIRPELFAFAVAQHLVLLEMRREEGGVEEVFRQLTRAEPA